MAWTTPKYGRLHVNRAGKTLKTASSPSEKRDEALTVLNNWRSSHSSPLNIFQNRLRRVSKRIDPNSLVVQRLKRVPSIINKLKRAQTQTMDLSQMQDIGGCRSILSNIDNVNKLAQDYIKNKGLKHRRVNQKDYIQNPKSDGYRGIHLIYKYKSDKKSVYDGLLIEIQIRTKIQHSWSTAVETVDLFTKQAIKSNEGKQEWKDFFKLVSSAFAIMENQSPIPDTPTAPEELHKEITKKVNTLRVFAKMKHWTKAIKFIAPDRKKSHFFLLELDLKSDGEKLQIKSYPKGDEPIATEHYLQSEKEQGTDFYKDIVLVGADSIEELKQAYPNYFIDTAGFLEYLKSYLNKENLS
jgi:ppGpp synthetase/RelA/SpoT-type nucleotidyltranferase